MNGGRGRSRRVPRARAGARARARPRRSRRVDRPAPDLVERRRRRLAPSGHAGRGSRSGRSGRARCEKLASARKRGRARQARMKVSCTASSASAADPSSRDGERVEPVRCGRRAAANAAAVASLRLPYEAIVRMHPTADEDSLWHGYLLGGTGSNVYTRCLARAWSSPRARGRRLLPGSASRAVRRRRGTASVRPDIGPTPARVRRRSLRGHRGRRVQDLGWAERERFVEANAAAVREHLPGRPRLHEPPDPRRARSAPPPACPYAVKAHGSELEFSMRGNDELCEWAREYARDRRRAVVAGTEHVAG